MCTFQPIYSSVFVYLFFCFIIKNWFKIVLQCLKFKCSIQYLSEVQQTSYWTKKYSLFNNSNMTQNCSFIQRSSTSTAAAAFAIATSASSNPRELSPLHDQRCCSVERKRKESVMSTAATMRVLNVLKHWISKHPQVPF